MGKNWLLYTAGLAGTVVFHAFYFGWYSWFLLVLVLSLPLFSLVVSVLAQVLDAAVALQEENDLTI